MRERFERWILGIIEWALSAARREPGISHDEYRDLERQANELRSQFKRQQSSDRGLA